MTGPRRSNSPPAEPTRPRRRWRVWLLALVAAGIALVVVAPWVPRTVPEEILGVWLTTDSTYQGRALELQPHALNFRGGGAGEQPVRRVRREVEGARIRYQIDYDAGGGLATLSFTYAPGPDVIKLDSRPNVLWKRFKR